MGDTMIKTIIINDENVCNEPTNKKMKSRALLVNSSNELLVANYGGVFLLPGGTIDDGETPGSAIVRELKEEIGANFEGRQLKPFAKLKYFQPHYPQRNGMISDRVVVTYYYIGKLDSISEDRNLTESEKKDGFDVQFYSLNQIESLLKKDNQSNNPRTQYFNRELREIINEYKKRQKLKVQEKEKQL